MLFLWEITQLFTAAHAQFSASLHEATHLMEKEFKIDPLQARDQTNSLKITFANSTALSLSEYLKAERAPTIWISSTRKRRSKLPNYTFLRKTIQM